MSKVGRNDPCPCGSGKKDKHCCGAATAAPTGAVAAATSASPVPAPSAAPDSSAAAIPRDLAAIGPRRLERAVADTARLLSRRDPDRAAAVETLFGGLLDGVDVPRREPTTPLERAQDLVDDAYAAKGRRQERMVRQALEICPDCVDAYLFLGNTIARTPEQALDFYRQAVAAGERALGADGLARSADELWDDPVAAPYLEARFGLTQALLALERHEETIAEAFALLRLDPDDDQGVGDLLLPELIRAGRNEEAADLLKRFPDEWSAAWQYSRVLVKFRLLGDTIFSRRAVVEAVAVNPLVPPYLFGQTSLPEEPPSLLGLDDEGEAQWYAALAATLWRETPGAVEWLAGVIADDAATREENAARRTGPRFFLNPDDDRSFTRCPECDRKTKPRDQHLVILIEPSHLLVDQVACRYCPTDDLLIARRGDLEPPLAAALDLPDADLDGTDYVVVGVIARADMLEGQGELDPAWAIAKVQAFREIYRPEDDDFAPYLDDVDPDLTWDLVPFEDEEEDEEAPPAAVGPIAIAPASSGLRTES